MRRAVRLAGRTVRASLRLESINFSGRIRLRGCGCNQGCAHVDDSPIRVPPCRPILASAPRRFRSWVPFEERANRRRRRCRGSRRVAGKIVRNERTNEGSAPDPVAMSIVVNRTKSSRHSALFSPLPRSSPRPSAHDGIETLNEIGRRDAAGRAQLGSHFASSSRMQSPLRWLVLSALGLLPVACFNTSKTTKVEPGATNQQRLC
jgi:hypothetical protein